MKDSIVAVYCRLSKEDLDKEKNESESIKNQKVMLESYALERGWSIYDFYIDEDYSGSDRDRPEFNRMITDSLLGRFNIVLCKKQARFARDIEYIEKYVHGIFSEHQIRFVAVLDNIDTGALNRSVKKASQINSLVDEWYLSDLSENIISALTTKRKNAEFIGSWAPYGYRKDSNNKNTLIIDPIAATVVKEIFELYQNGYGISKISQTLNQKGIPNPLTYKQENDEKINPNPSRKTLKRHFWTPSTVSSILHNQIYIGDMVQGKYKKANYKSKKLLRVPKPDWIVIPNSHQPIIDSEIWQAVQKKLDSKSRVSANKQRHHLLAGKVYCAECGSKLISSGGRSGQKRITYLCCSSHNLLKSSCTGSRIERSSLENVILDQINSLSDQYFELDYLLKHIHFEETAAELRNKSLINRLSELKTQIKSIDIKKEILYSDRLNNIIDHEQYLFFRNKLDQELNENESEQNLLQSKISKLDIQNPESYSLNKIIESYRILPFLTQEIVDQLIESVYVSNRKKGKPQQITINWNF